MKSSTSRTGLRLLNAQPGERALEFGFGTGHSLVALAQSVGETGRVCGVDLSPGMIDVARERIEQEQLTDRVMVQRGNVLHLPYADDTFDVVFSSFMLDLIDTPDLPTRFERVPPGAARKRAGGLRVDVEGVRGARIADRR